MIIEKFEHEVKKNPNHIAVKIFDNEITYKMLNNHANVLARKIVNNYNTINLGDKKKIVALLFEHCKDMIIGTIGALKAQTIYVPLDPSYPIIRLAYMLEDSEADFIVTNNKNLDFARCLIKEAKVDVKIINIDKFDIKYSTENLNLKICRDDVAYILYTSGSTGNPKGIIQTHRNILHFIECYKNTLSITNEDRMTLFSAFSHDAAIMDIYGALLNGATLYPLNIKSYIGINEIANWIEMEKITIWHSVPTAYRCFINALTGKEKFSTLRFIVLGGEKVILHDVEMFQKTFTNAKLVNLYGQTESSFNSAQIYSVDSKVKRVTLGEPVQGTKVLVVDGNREEVSPLNIGEIVILSDYIALGYWKDEEKSREVFQYNLEVGRTYWSGDLGKLLPDGNIEFIGRKDSQVKIRGYRIEVEEIENNLLKNQIVKEVVVLARNDENGYDYLCAYIVSDKELSSSYLSKYLFTRTPDYMIPSYFVQLDKMPLTPNGKIDRKALPEPDGSIATRTEYEAPRNETEEKLASIWSEVLEVDKIGINDNFFELGGHSLKVTVLISKMHKGLNVDVPFREIFKSPTLKGISEYIENTEKNIYSPIEISEEKEYYEASSAQKRMYLLQQFDLKSIGYNMPELMVVEGELDVERLEESFIKLISRHESLRTSFEVIEDKIVQRVNRNFNFKLEWFEVDCIKDTGKTVDNIVKGFVRAFDLNKSPLLRVGLIKLEEDNHILMFDIHHIISDGISMGILLDEFAKIYDGSELEQLKIQYKDYSEWQNKFLKSEEIQKQKEYWINRFSNEIPVLNMPTDFQRPSMQSFEGDSIGFILDKELTNKLKKISKETESTMYMVLLSGINILLSKYSGQEDIIIGTPTAGRPHADTEKIIGVFVNTLSMRNYPNGKMIYVDFLKEVKENALKAYENQDYQFDEIVDNLSIRRDMSRNPLFDVMFKMQNYDSNNTELKDLVIKGYNQANKIANFDLTISANELGENIILNFEYNTKLYKKETIERMIKHFVNIVIALTVDTKIKLNEIDILTEEEKYKVLNEFNDTYVDYPKDKTIQELFEEQVERTPDNIAVIFEDKKLTYRELNERANQLARILRSKGVKADSIVGIMVDRSLEMIIGTIGILKSGAACLPINISYPEKRIEYMFKDSNVNIVLTSKEYSKKIKEYRIEPIDIYDERNYSKEENGDLDIVNEAQDLFYIVYTSGTTGNPKGVMVGQRVITNLIYFDIYKAYIDFSKRVLQFSNVSFDAYFHEVFATFLHGGTLYIIDEETKQNIHALLQFINDNNITTLNFPAALVKFIFNDENYSFRFPKCVKELIATAEQLIIPEKLKKHAKENKMLIHNQYGPSETHVVTAFTMGWNKAIDSIPPIGKPINNSKAYIVDSLGNPQPVGVPGELWVSGDCLGIGYLNKGDLTREKFVDNPFESGTKMYRTGDLVRWLPDGNIEFLGRIDNQVKIRGFRIELSEIENKLLQHKDVKESVAIAIDGKNEDKYICAYIVSEKEISELNLNVYLKETLPEYMIPSYFIKLDKMPITSNGKLDRRVLPRPNIDERLTIYEAPRNTIEEILVKIWSEVLGIDKIGINDNFFELGGHSLKATMLSGKIYKEFNIEVPLNVIFKIPTIKDISKCILNREIFNEYKNYSESQVVTKLNELNDKNIFLFPPTLGYGIVYNEFANYIENRTVYSFDFIEDGNRIKEYVRQISNIQKEGKFILMGYSAGGNLAFEVAKELETSGYDVSDVILLDSDVKDEKVSLTPKNFTVFDRVIENVRLNLNIPFIVEYVSESVQKKLEAFIPYWNELINNGNINANIHFISCLNENIDKDILDIKLNNANKWVKLTKKSFEFYQGYGEHREMVDGDVGKLNAQIVNKIIN